MKKRILIVEDDTDVLKFTMLRLSKMGYCVESALDGEDALKKVREWRPDLMILDINIPKIDGYGVYQSIRSKPETESLPVIFASANLQANLPEKARELGIEHYFIKPFDTTELIEKVKILLT
ncbi:MAG: response regulator [Candidatus Omnitrophica bacterium]|nr:response regulator [Candidatus Omnitrophota bacterium]